MISEQYQQYLTKTGFLQVLKDFFHNTDPHPELVYGSSFSLRNDPNQVIWIMSYESNMYLVKIKINNRPVRSLTYYQHEILGA